jgi:hypothetical protein
MRRAAVPRRSRWARREADGWWICVPGRRAGGTPPGRGTRIPPASAPPWDAGHSLRYRHLPRRCIDTQSTTSEAAWEATPHRRPPHTGGTGLASLCVDTSVLPMRSAPGRPYPTLRRWEGLANLFTKWYHILVQAVTKSGTTSKSSEVEGEGVDTRERRTGWSSSPLLPLA